MPRLLRMPEVAANMAEAVLQEWAVPENAPFTATDAIATVETEKAVVDIEAEADGVLLRTLVPGGTQVQVGAPIALLGDPGEKVSDVDAALADLGVAAGPGSGSVIRSTGSTTRDVPDPEGGTANTETTAVQTEAGAANTAGQTVDGGDGDRVFASPLARRLAREAGLRLETIRGTGPRGRVLRRDVEAAAVPEAAVAPAPTEPAVATGTNFTDVPHTRMRRAIAERLSHSKQTIPHFYLRATVRADALLRLRTELNDGSTPKVSLNDLVVKAVGRAHALVPEMNVTWAPDAVRQYAGVDVAVAVATERGLVTPVVRGVDSLSLTAVAASVRDLVERAKSGRLRQEELEGGSISVTNLGMFDVEEFAAIINPPQAAILAVGAVRTEPMVVDGEVVAGSVIRVTLSVDHRPVDGVVAARWLQAFVRLVENPVRILA